MTNEKNKNNSESDNKAPMPPGAPDRTPMRPPTNDPKDKPMQDPKKRNDDVTLV